MTQHDARADFVERFARQIESNGQPRIAGRIYAYLATDEAPYLSLKELAERLSISKASVSTNTRLLISMSLIERAAVPGSREEHYAVTPDGMMITFRTAAVRARQMAALAEEGLRLAPNQVSAGRRSLAGAVEVYGRMAGIIEGITDPVTDEPKRKAVK